MKPETGIDPRLEEILRDVAAQPGSTLLRVPAAEIGRHLTGSAWTADHRSRLLTNAERELARMHREEVALLLRRACLADVLDESGGRVLPLDPGDPGPDRSHVARDARDLCYAARLSGEVQGALALLRHVAAPGREPGTVELALASMRLAPSDEALIYLGVGLLTREQPRAAERVLRSVLSGSPEAVIESIAWEDVGLVRDAIGDDAGAARAYGRAALAPPPRALPALLWLRSSLRVGRRADALRASRWVEETVVPSDPAYRAFLRFEQGVEVDGSSASTRTARALFTELENEMGAMSKEAVHAIL